MGTALPGTPHFCTTRRKQSTGEGGEVSNLTDAKPVQHGDKGDNEWTPWLRM